MINFFKNVLSILVFYMGVLGVLEVKANSTDINQSIGSMLKLEKDIVFPAGKDSSFVLSESDNVKEIKDMFYELGMFYTAEYLSGESFYCSAYPKDRTSKTSIIPKNTIITINEVETAEMRNQIGNRFYQCFGPFKDTTDLKIQANFKNAKGKKRSFSISCKKIIYFTDLVDCNVGYVNKTSSAQRLITLEEFLKFNNRVFSIYSTPSLENGGAVIY